MFCSKERFESAFSYNFGVPALVHLSLFGNPTCRYHAFLGEIIVIMAMSKPLSTYAFGSTDISILRLNWNDDGNAVKKAEGSVSVH